LSNSCGSGKARQAAQYVRANRSPSELRGRLQPAGDNDATARRPGSKQIRVERLMRASLITELIHREGVFA
jgi:hypothetical protein